MNCFRKGKLSFDEIKKWLIDLRSNSYVPLSGFCVSAVMRIAVGEREDYYISGVNIENVDNVLSTHAEESTIALMATAFGNSARIKEVWVMGASRDALNNDDLCSCCGKCRQHISEFADADVKIHYMTMAGSIETHSIDEILPDSFSLKEKSVSYLKRLSTDEIFANLTRSNISDADILPWLKDLEAIDFISKTSKRVIIKLSNDNYVAGVSVESSAFLSVSAVQSAIAVAIAEYRSFKISEVYLYSSGREDKKLAPNQFIPLSMAEIQNLREFALHDDIPIRIFTESGKNISVLLPRSIMFLYNSRKKVCEV